MTLPPPSRPRPPWQQPSYGPPAVPGPQMVSSAPVSGFAIASLVCSLVCLAPLGLVFGIIALVRTSRRGERGKGLAVAGVAVSGAVLVLAFLMLVGALRFSAWSSGSPAGPVRGDRGTSVFALETGDCFTPATVPTQDNQGSIRNGTAERLPCEEPHRGEIYGSFELTGQEAFPGPEEIMKTSRDRCGVLLPEYAVDLTAQGPLQTYFYYPDQAGWERGGRTVLCWAGAPRGDLDASIRKEESAFEPAQFAYVSAFRPLWEAQLRAPQREPEEDLAAASRWAGQMAAAYAEAARLLGDARGGLPGDVRGPAGEIVMVFEAAVPHWEQAARAADSDAFLAAIEQADRDNDLTVGLDAEIRKGVGLPVAESAAAGREEGV
ncbi:MULTISPECIES: DUF4190 domain-containing protein [Streptomyces]|uniref:DUF4190 domain-containing protein n=1 Tax=Streptomyces salyersiae TaxID=3075530 RepID=A0ABU2RMJ6_9ACTN|nr:DUF4190 domain-containing protein [Streptomyces sp. DSM 41770]MDT0430045.1 DUF4190 domain-containing protein [Streptomyces sp. DSM 41770]